MYRLTSNRSAARRVSLEESRQAYREHFSEFRETSSRWASRGRCRYPSDVSGSPFEDESIGRMRHLRSMCPGVTERRTRRALGREAEDAEAGKLM